MNLEHDFDWKGFVFAVRLIAVLVVVGVVGQYGLIFTQAFFVSQEASASVAVLPAVPGNNSIVISDVSSTSPERVISTLTIADAVPTTGKFIAADLVNKKIFLYQDGAQIAEYPILTIGRPDTRFETPSGFYKVLTKEHSHFNKSQEVYMPYSMQFYGNYFIHGWPYYPNGTPVASTYSGGCIRLSTADAEKVFDFADTGTSVFAYESHQSATVPSLVLGTVKRPSILAASYLVADIDTGDVLLEHDAATARPIASVTKLMTALVANETIMFNKDIPVPRGILLHPKATTTVATVRFPVGDLLYPLLMESNNIVAAKLAEYYGTPGFIEWMNTTAGALNMTSTSYEDASGISSHNVSTTEDLYRLAVYLTNKKAFIWDITRTPTKTLVAPNGSAFTFSNYNHFSNLSSFVGGKVGYTEQALHTMASVFSTSVEGVTRRVAIIVLRSTDSTTDTRQLADWFTRSVERGTGFEGTACASCARATTYRKIAL